MNEPEAKVFDPTTWRYVSGPLYRCEIVQTRYGHRVRFPYMDTHTPEGGRVTRWVLGSQERAERWARRYVARDKRRLNQPATPTLTLDLA